MRIQKSSSQKCIPFDPSLNLFSTSFLSCKTAQKQPPTGETKPAYRGENSKNRLLKTGCSIFAHFGLGFSLVVSGSGLMEVSHLRSKVTKSCNRKSRKAFRKRSRKSSSERGTRERWSQRLPERFLNTKPWLQDLGLGTDFEV